MAPPLSISWFYGIGSAVTVATKVFVPTPVMIALVAVVGAVTVRVAVFSASHVALGMVTVTTS